MSQKRPNTEAFRISTAISYIICAVVYISLLVIIGLIMDSEHILSSIFQFLLSLLPISLIIAFLTFRDRHPNWLPLTQFFWIYVPFWLADQLAADCFADYEAKKEAKLLKSDENNSKEFTVKWDNVKFETDKIDIFLKERAAHISFPCASKSVYEDYKKMHTSDVEDIKLRVKDGSYYVIEESVLVIIRLLELLEKARVEHLNEIINSNPEIKSAINNQATIIITIQATKSDYLKHLLENQTSEIEIVKTSECCAYATSTSYTFERAFIFTLKNNRTGQYSVVYENENDNNASVVAKVHGVENVYKCMDTMIKYMNNHRIKNKREKLHHTHAIDNLSIKIVKHDDIANWKSNVTGAYYVRQTAKYLHTNSWRKY